MRRHSLHAHAEAVVREVASIYEVKLGAATDVSIASIQIQTWSLHTLWSGTTSRFHVPPPHMLVQGRCGWELVGVVHEETGSGAE